MNPDIQIRSPRTESPHWAECSLSLNSDPIQSWTKTEPHFDTDSVGVGGFGRAKDPSRDEAPNTKCEPQGQMEQGTCASGRLAKPAYRDKRMCGMWTKWIRLEHPSQFIHVVVDFACYHRKKGLTYVGLRS